jgi:hypothetical protein
VLFNERDLLLTILSAFAKLPKTTISPAMFAVRTGQLGSHKTDFHEI